MLVAEDRREALRDDSVRGQPTREQTWHAELLELTMKPLGEILVVVTVTEERVIACPQPPFAAAPHLWRRGFHLERTVICGQLGKLGHRPPPSESPLTLLTQRDNRRESLRFEPL